MNIGTDFTTVVGGDGMGCHIDYTDDNYRYGEFYFGGIFRSSGSYYDQIGGDGYNGITESGNWVTPYMLHRTDPTCMFAGYLNVWRCNNVKDASGVTWIPISSGETTICNILEQSPAKPDILYVVRDSELKRTSHANAAVPSWTTCSLPGGIYTPTCLAANPTDTNTVYATALFWVYKSTDRGATWTNISGSLPAIPMNCLVYDKNSNEGIYIGTQTGIYYKDATMPDWVPFNSGLPVVDVRDLEIYYGNSWASSKIKAATYGRGLWQSDLIETGVLNPSAFTANPVSMTEVDLSWVKNPTNNNVLLAYYTSGTFGTPLNGTSYIPGAGIPGGGTVIYNGSVLSFNHTSLTGNTSYYYKIWSYNGSTQYSIGAVANATTFCTLIAAFPWSEGFEEGGAIPLYWSEQYVNGTADWAYQTGGYTGWWEPPTAHTGTYNATYFYPDYTEPFTKLITPPLNLTLITTPVLRFWHTQAYWTGGQDELRIYYRTSTAGIGRAHV